MSFICMSRHWRSLKANWLSSSILFRWGHWKRPTPSLFEWASLRWLTCHQLSSVRSFIWISCASSTVSLHALKLTHFCQQRLGQRWWFWGTEPSPSLWAPCRVGGWLLVIPSGKEQSLSIDKAGIFPQVKSGGKLEPQSTPSTEMGNLY